MIYMRRLNVTEYYAALCIFVGCMLLAFYIWNTGKFLFGYLGAFIEHKSVIITTYTNLKAWTIGAAGFTLIMVGIRFLFIK
jgi:hypothetical protein